MFFIVSKVFWLIAQPLSVLLLLLVAGLVCMMMRRQRWAIGFFGTGIVVLVLSGFTNLGMVLLAPLENRFARAELPEQVDAIVVLGGATHNRIGAARGVTELNAAADRLTEAVALAQRFAEAKIVFSGGSGELIAGGESEAQSAERFFLNLGIAPDRLVLEDASRNTAENAEFTVDLLKGAQNVVLVTSAFHMPRSMGLYRAYGFEMLPWPSDYRSTGEEWFGVDVANLVLNLEALSIGMREWIGLSVYHWSGRIESIFPGPLEP